MIGAPVVTVVTPWHNHAPFAQEYFEGLLAQTYRKLEVIIFDDGSTDGSWPVLQTWASRLERVFPRVLVRRHANRGGPRTLESLYAAATGKYVCVLESDDCYLPEKVESNVEYLENYPEVGVVHGGAEIHRGKKVSPAVYEYRGRPVPTGDVFLELLTDYNFVVTCTSCCRTELVQRYISPVRYSNLGYLMGDYPTWLDLAKRTRFGYIAAPLARYRILDESASHTRVERKAFSFKKSFHQIRLDYIEDNLSRVKADEEVYHRLLEEFIGIVYWLREGWDYAGALGFLRQMLRIWGYEQTVLRPLVKLFPHLLISLGTRRRAGNGFLRV